MQALNIIKVKHPKTIIIGHININGVRIKFIMCPDILQNDVVDILSIIETQLDPSFSKNRLKIEGFNRIRNDFFQNSGYIMFIVRDDILMIMAKNGSYFTWLETSNKGDVYGL